MRWKRLSPEPSRPGPCCLSAKPDPYTAKDMRSRAISAIIDSLAWMIRAESPEYQISERPRPNLQVFFAPCF